HAKALIRTNKYQKAIPILKSIGMNASNQGENTLLLAYCYLLSGRYSLTAEMYKKVIERGTGPIKEQALYCLSLLDILQKKYTVAEKNLDKLIKNSQKEEYFRARIYLYLLKKDYGQAQQAISDVKQIKGKDLDPDPELELYLAFCQLKRGSKEHITTLLQFQYDLFKHKKIKNFLLKSLFQNGRHKEIIDGLSGFSEDEYSPFDFKILEICYALAEEYDSAYAILDSAIKKGFADNEIQLEMGRIHFLLNEIDEGRAQLRVLTEKKNLPEKIRKKARKYLSYLESSDSKTLEEGMDLQPFLKPYHLDPVPDLRSTIKKASQIH
ncbi:tetratricopeptide repeat protein, partial [Candidatus Riflebacteria bacterium]